VESVESQKKASHSSHEPLGNLAKKPARFPHSHSSGDEGGWKSGKPKAGFPLSHRLDFSLSLSKEQNRSASGLRPPPAAALLSASVVPFCSAVVGNFHSALDKKIGEFHSPGDCQTFLNQWISHYVMLDDLASQEARARFPLREALVHVAAEPSEPNTLRTVVFLRPHFQLDEMTVSLRLVVHLPSLASIAST
jgi:hypothetical protein